MRLEVVKRFGSESDAVGIGLVDYILFVVIMLVVIMLAIVHGDELVSWFSC